MMLSLNDIINVGFRKSGFSGYRTDDVDEFVDKIRESYDELLKRCSSAEEQVEQLKAGNQQNVEKLKVLAKKIEEYRAQEDEIKNALISAQKLSDASVREARHKAEIIVKDANLKGEHIIDDADRKIMEQKKELERIQKAVSDFRSKLLSTYKEHLTLIDALPTYKPEPAPVPKEKPVQQPVSAVPPQQPAAPKEAEPEPSAAGGTPEDEAPPLVSNFED